METLTKFVFGTVVCDGCAKRVDSNQGDGLVDVDALVDYYLGNFLEWRRIGDGDEKWYCPQCARDKAHRKCPGEGRVIREKTALYGLKCDLCGRGFEDLEGHSCWEDESAAKSEARYDGWEEIGGKWYCPDCHRMCPVLEDTTPDDNWEEKYCSGCQFKDDCTEYVPREIPTVSAECLYAVVHPDKGWVKCPWLKASDDKEWKCVLPEGSECPRVQYWRQTGRAKQENFNEDVRRECGLQ